MRQKQKITHLQKPKRIRKNKKDFLRGSIVREEPKVMYGNASIPLPYIVLFLALSGTIIGYTSLTFLFTKIHVNTPSLLSLFFAYLSALKLPHIMLPSITIPAIPLPYLAIPALRISLPTIHISLPSISINLSPLFTWIEQSVAETIPALISFMNPLPFWTEVFSTTIQAVAISCVWTLSFLESLHLMETAENVVTQTGTGVQWLAVVFGEYVKVLGIWLVGIMQTFFQLSRSLLIALVEATIQHFIILKESIAMSWDFLEIVVLYIINLQTNMTELYITGIKIFFFETFTIVISIINTFMFVGETIALSIWHVFVVIFDWLLSILFAIKKSIDQTLAAIAAVIHLGDPLYNAIGESINELFTAMGATITLLPKILK